MRTRQTLVVLRFLPTNRTADTRTGRPICWQHRQPNRPCPIPSPKALLNRPGWFSRRPHTRFGRRANRSEHIYIYILKLTIGHVLGEKRKKEKEKKSQSGVSGKGERPRQTDRQTHRRPYVQPEGGGLEMGCLCQGRAKPSQAKPRLKVPPLDYNRIDRNKGKIDVLNHSLDAAHSRDRMSSVWARPTHSINCRVNGIEAHSLDKLSSHSAFYRVSEWDIGPFAGQVIEWVGQMPSRQLMEWVGLCLIHSTVYQLSGSGAWGIIQRMKELAAKNYGEGDFV